VWVVLLLTPLMFSYSHPQWRLLALLLLLLYTLVFIVQEVRPCVSFSVFGGGKRCFQAVRRVLCKKRSVGMLQVLLFRPAPAQPQETEKTSILFTLLGVVAAVCILGLAASLSTVDMQVSFVSAFLTF
jgi:hypothetical protein